MDDNDEVEVLRRRPCRDRVGPRSGIGPEFLSF